MGATSYNRPSYNAPNNNNNGNNNNNNIDTDVITINNQGPFGGNRDPDVIVGQDPRAVDPGEIMMRWPERVIPTIYLQISPAEVSFIFRRLMLIIYKFRIVASGNADAGAEDERREE